VRGPARGCADWRATRRQVIARGGDLVPLPAEALDGLEAFAGSGGLTRRRLLQGGVGLVLASTLLASPRRVLEAAAAQAAEAPNATMLVSLYLDGGNDGLNTLVPNADPRYRQLRSRIGIPAEQTLPLADAPQFGWHPSLGGLKRLYDAGKVAVLPAVDYSNPDQSHFNSAAYWRTGVVGRNLDETGWLGRTLDAVGSRDNPLQGISVSWGFDPVLRSRRAPVGQVFDPSDFGFYIPGVWDEEAFTRPYRATTRGGRSTARREAKAAYRNAFLMRERLAPLHVDDKHPAPPVPLAYPDTDLGNGMRNLARMLGAGLGTRVAAISAGGGYDTHENQPDDHAKLLEDLGGTLEAWQADLTARGLSGRVLTLVWSEFGRRPEDNDSNGTDHGAGGLVLVVGDRANGGIRSEFPGLGRLDDDDNLLVSTEFRAVYATLLESWLGVEAARVLPGRIPGRLPLVRAA
jgi:uncharacterized protein (DUF1501 family)